MQGEPLDPYLIDPELGSGGMGTPLQMTADVHPVMQHSLDADQLVGERVEDEMPPDVDRTVASSDRREGRAALGAGAEIADALAQASQLARRLPLSPPVVRVPPDALHVGDRPRSDDDLTHPTPPSDVRSG